jgi:chromosome segregation ATPase
MEESEKLVEEARNVLRQMSDLQYELRDYEKRRSEILRMYSTGQVSREVFEGLMGELRQKMYPLVRKYFELKAKLRDLESQLRLVVTRLSVEAKTSESSVYRASFERDQRVRQALSRVGSALEDVQRELKNADVERELRMLDVLLDALPREEADVWKQALGEVVEAWSRARFSYAGRIEEIERRIESLNDSLKELEVRFAVGEFERGEYEVRRSAIEREMGELQAQLEALQEKLEDLDLIAARCREYLAR